jgi:hypothetical protein
MKKRKKKSKELWHNMISLNQYKGKLDISLIDVIKEGKKDIRKKNYSNFLAIILQEKKLNRSLKVLIRNVILSHENVGQNRRIVNASRKQSIIAPTLI